jgi:NAD(P)-dependent dehydrogenase (short-subunit alcohol dehydrogenase family)
MTKKLEGKTAVITGGTEGIGLATAKLFVKEGAYVFITGRRQKELDEAVKAIGTNVSGVQGDVAQLADLDRLYETVSKVKGRIDIVFANAGVGEFVPLGAVTEEHFDKLFNINVRGTLFTVQKALPLLNDGGSIILNGSVASVKGTAAFGVYAASKACNPLFRAYLDYRSEGPSHPLERCQSGSDQYAAGEPAIRRRDSADCVHHPDGTHGGTRGSC